MRKPIDRPALIPYPIDPHRAAHQAATSRAVKAWYGPQQEALNRARRDQVMAILRGSSLTFRALLGQMQLTELQLKNTLRQLDKLGEIRLGEKRCWTIMKKSPRKETP